MELDWTSAALRFGLYAAFSILFGLPLFSLYALRADERPTIPGRALPAILTACTVLGIALSVFGLVVMAKNMTGAADYRTLERHAFGMILEGTDFGSAWVARMVALAGCGVGVILLRSNATHGCRAIAGCGAIALASLAWAGHGAMDEGWRGFLHFAADIMHLMAAGAWVGALLSFLTLCRSAKGRDDFAVLARTSTGFAVTGTFIVAALVLTGGINYYLTAGPDLQLLYRSAYGQLLSLKLGFFAIMLLLAAINRYRLAPRIMAALAKGDGREACAELGKSLKVEFACALAILSLVAVFGLLSPS